VTIFFGLAYFLITDIFLAMLAWPIEVSMTRVFGAVFIGVAISSLYGFRAESWDRVEIVVLMEIVLTLFGLIAMIWNMLTILTLPLIGWAFAGLFGLFFILFLYSYLTH
jgi:hypothetical protein